jgi:hypothetical protein
MPVCGEYFQLRKAKIIGAQIHSSHIEQIVKEMILDIDTRLNQITFTNISKKNNKKK